MLFVKLINWECCLQTWDPAKFKLFERLINIKIKEERKNEIALKAYHYFNEVQLVLFFIIYPYFQYIIISTQDLNDIEYFSTKRDICIC